MPQNSRTPAMRARALENVCLPADSFQIAPSPLEIQIRRLARRFNMSPAVASAVANLAYGEGASQ